MNGGEQSTATFLRQKKQNHLEFYVKHRLYRKISIQRFSFTEHLTSLRSLRGQPELLCLARIFIAREYSRHFHSGQEDGTMYSIVSQTSSSIEGFSADSVHAFFPK